MDNVSSSRAFVVAENRLRRLIAFFGRGVLGMGLVEKRQAVRALTRGALGCAVGALAVLSATGAGAAVVETLSTSSSYTYDLAPGLPGLNSGTGDTGLFHVTGSNPLQATDIQINYGTLTASNASFFFLHNIQCKGYCSIGVTTLVTDTITNTGSAAIDLRFDSSITAGHLGIVQNAPTPSAGIFEFKVTQTTGGSDHQLYDALGKISSSGASITTSDGSVFNGLASYHDPAQTGLDWDETPVSVLLDPLAPGASTTVTYSSLTYLNAYGVCTNVTLCDGVQVAFGDPRNNGGVFNFATMLGASATEPVGWVLDRGFDMASVKIQLVDVTSRAPEPASWAMMLVGFGMTGAAVRGRRGRRLAAA